MQRRLTVMALAGLGLVSAAAAVAGAGEAPLPPPRAAAGPGARSGALEPLLDAGIDWPVFQAIQSAAAEASRRGVNVEQCRIQAFRSDERLVVAFGNPDPAQSSLGCPPGPCRCFQVEVTRDGRQVLGAGFSQ